MRTFLTTLVLLGTAVMSVVGCGYWYDGHTFKKWETHLYNQTGYSQAKAECVASSGSSFSACMIAEREDRDSTDLD